MKIHSEVTTRGVMQRKAWNTYNHFYKKSCENNRILLLIILRSLTSVNDLN